MTRSSWGLLALLALGCLPADPPEGASRRPSSAAHSTLGPRLGGAASTPARLPAALRTEAPSGASGGSSARGASPAVKAAAPSADPILKAPFHDDFARTSLGPAYRATSNAFRIENERLCVRGARNHPLWLAQRLPRNARIEFDAVSSSEDGDIKVEAWGDGRSSATTVSYTNATSYLFILGGWKNSLHVLARLDEHAQNRAELRLDPDADDPRTAPVEPGRPYHFMIERRDGRTVRFSVDEVEILTLTDPSPLEGPGHEHFGFNDWETQVCFDNLDILPLDG
ncbi:MAG TPA: hypothetical protein VG937_31295 [Polyangiaceae bacterium]|nr:hypothetical protein [Polyangiaceae bacterium]